jgi:competence protein ComEA
MFNRKEQTALLLLGAALLLGSGLVAVDHFRPSAMEEFRVIPAAVAPPAVAAQTIQVAQPGNPPPASGRKTSAVPAAQSGLVDVNHATAVELQRLPGIGPKIAARIVGYRDEHGPFATIDDLAKVSGIGPRTVAKLRPLVVCGSAANP